MERSSMQLGVMQPQKKTVKEIIVISGKGGTGKTSIAASFAALAKQKVLADCDVDAADLHLILEPNVRERHEFIGGKKAFLDPSICEKSGICYQNCRFNAVVYKEDRNGKRESVYDINPLNCEGCGVCAYFCPANAIELRDVVNGEWFVSETRHGTMVHARLGIGEENSGKLVSVIREKAKQIAEIQHLPLVIIDGAPGIGCPVISSLTGVDFALVVTEPTISGEHDFKRVVELAKQFYIPTAVSVNKYDLNPEMTERIEQAASEMGVQVLCRIPFDPEIVKAQIEKKSIVEYSSGPAAEAVASLFEQVINEINACPLAQKKY